MNGDEPRLPVDALIERFGGIRPMAAKLEVPVTTVQGWKERGAIPDRRWTEIAEAARRNGIDLSGTPPLSGDAPLSADPLNVQPQSVPLSHPAGAPPRPVEWESHTDHRMKTESSSMHAAGAPSSAAPARRSSWTRIVLLCVILAAAATAHLYRDRIAARLRGGSEMAVTAPQPTGEMPPLAAPAPSKAEPSSPEQPKAESKGEASSTADRLAAIETRLAASDAATIAVLKAENRRLTEDVARLQSRVADFEREAAKAGAARERARGFVVAAGQLRAALASAQPFQPSLELLGAMGGDDAGVRDALAPLAAYAERGVPTRAALAARFDTVAADMMRARADTGGGLWSRFVQALGRLIVVRRVAEAEGLEAALARAETALEHGDVQTAVDIVSGIGGAEGAPAAPWLADARARLAADRALAALDRHIVSLVGSGSP